MKKILFGLLIASSLFSFSQNAHALSCKTGQAGNSDECWTEVRVSERETNVVSAGAVLVYDINTDSADENAFDVVLSTASADSHLIAGVAQNIIATGDTGMVLVRGKGKLCIRGGVATGDRVFTSASEGLAGTTVPSAGTSPSNVSSGDPIGFALQSGTNATIDAYIRII